MELKIALNAILVVITVVAGLFMHKMGKPYNNIVFNIHKFATIGLVVYLTFLLFNYSKTHDIELFPSIFAAMAAISVLALMISGALLSLDKFFDRMLLIHRISTLSFIIFVVASVVSLS
jgi:hypothetical protein